MTFWLNRNRLESSWSLDHIDPLPGRALRAHVADLMPASGRGPLPNGGDPLPDEPPRDPSTVRFSAGSLDGIMSVRGGRSEGNAPLAAASATLNLVRQDHPTTKDAHTAATAINSVDGPQAMDRFLETIRSSAGNFRARIAETGRWLCTRGTTRQQAKVGLALLGISGQPEDAPLIIQLGLLEELTLYSVVALKNLLGEADSVLLDLGQQVMGWGRIHCIQRLKDSPLPEVRYWLVHGGYVNGIMTEEVAFTVASAGNLRAALETEPDEVILDHAGALLEALAMGGPAEDMTDYEDAGPVLTLYLDRMSAASASLDRAGHLATLDRYVHGWASENPQLTASTLEELRQSIDRILVDGRWRVAVAEGLLSDDLWEVRRCLAISERFGLDPIPIAREWILREPRDGYLWQTLVSAADRDELAELVDLAEALLPFSAVPIGPVQHLGLGPGFEANHCFELILQRLTVFPGVGASAVLIGLEGQVTRTRHLALRVLAEWPPESWPSTARDTVEATAWRDPDDQVRKRARDLLDGRAAD